MSDICNSSFWNANTTLSAACPTWVTLAPDEPYVPGDPVTCDSNGYQPTYEFFDTSTGLSLGTTNPYVIPATGAVALTCRATVNLFNEECTRDQYVCGRSLGKYRKLHDIVVTISLLMLMALSVEHLCLRFNCIALIRQYFRYFETTGSL